MAEVREGTAAGGFEEVRAEIRTGLQLARRSGDARERHLRPAGCQGTYPPVGTRSSDGRASKSDCHQGQNPRATVVAHVGAGRSGLLPGLPRVRHGEQPRHEEADDHGDDTRGTGIRRHPPGRPPGAVGPRLSHQRKIPAGHDRQIQSPGEVGADRGQTGSHGGGGSLQIVVPRLLMPKADYQRWRFRIRGGGYPKPVSEVPHPAGLHLTRTSGSERTVREKEPRHSRTDAEVLGIGHRRRMGAVGGRNRLQHELRSALQPEVQPVRGRLRAETPVAVGPPAGEHSTVLRRGLRAAETGRSAEATPRGPPTSGSSFPGTTTTL